MFGSDWRSELVSRFQRITVVFSVVVRTFINTVSLVRWPDTWREEVNLLNGFPLLLILDHRAKATVLMRQQSENTSSERQPTITTASSIQGILAPVRSGESAVPVKAVDLRPDLCQY
jgi:hypothetical protein